MYGVSFLSIALFLSAVSLYLMHLCTLTHTISTKMQYSSFKLTMNVPVERAHPRGSQRDVVYLG